MTPFAKKVLNILQKKGAVTSSQSRELQERVMAGQASFEGYLIDTLGISNADLLRAKEEASGLEGWQYDPGNPVPPEMLQQIPKDAAQQYKIVPLEKRDGKLRLGLVNPWDLQAQEALRFALLKKELEPELLVVTERDFGRVLESYEGLRRVVTEALEELEESMAAEAPELPEGATPEEIVREAPITKVVAVIIKNAAEGKASDIHIEPLEEHTRVRFRVAGVLHKSLILPQETHAAVVSRVKILANLRLDETRIPQDGRFRTKVGGQGIDFRVSTFPTNLGEKVEIRVLDPSMAFRKLPDLGLAGPNLRRLEEGIKQPFGMILLSGPTGSGKSTTLYAALQLINKEGINIVSLEDPVEFNIAGVSQSEIRPEIDYTFASGLRHVVRQDPDVLMVGEIRDEETAALATHAALTGHLLFSTIHTNDAVGVIPRFIDLGIKQFLLPGTLNLAVAQRLVRKLCPECKKEVKPEAKILEIIEKELAKLPRKVLEEFGVKKPYRIFRPHYQDCDQCEEGVKGRIGIFEVLAMTDELQKIILEEPHEFRIRQEAERQGMLSMRQDGIIKALKGVVGFEEVMRVVELS